MEVPQGGIDCPDTCIGIVDSISVPSLPDVFSGKNILYVREENSQTKLVSFRTITVPQDHYPNNRLAQALGTAMNVGSTLGDTPYAWTIQDSHDLECAGTFPDANDSARILTDAEVRTNLIWTPTLILTVASTPPSIVTLNLALDLTLYVLHACTPRCEWSK